MASASDPIAIDLSSPDHEATIRLVRCDKDPVDVQRLQVTPKAVAMLFQVTHAGRENFLNTDNHGIVF